MSILQALPQIIAKLMGGMGGQQPMSAMQGAAPSPMPQNPQAPPQAIQPAQLQQSPMSQQPQGGMPQQQGPQSGMIEALMQRAQQGMNNPNAQFVPPQQQGVIDPRTHPAIASIIQSLGQAASNFGMTGMAPQERLQRQQLEQQKAESLASLAANAQYREGELDYRNRMADTAGQNADTKQAAQQTNADYKNFQKQNEQAKLEQAKMLGMARIDIQQGKLAQGAEKIANQASQFEKNFAIAKSKLGLEAAKNEMMEQGLGIKQQVVDVMRTAMQQRGTQEGAAAVQTLQKMQLEHPLLSEFFGIDTDALLGSPQPTPVPGTGAAVPTAPAPTQGAQPTVPAKKVTQQKPSAPAGVTHIWKPGVGIQPIGQP